VVEPAGEYERGSAGDGSGGWTRPFADAALSGNGGTGGGERTALCGTGETTTGAGETERGVGAGVRIESENCWVLA
jgi:hypothetical protein